jgi:hypothetical protein
MLNQTLLNGEMAGYNSAQVGVEVMIRRIESWRNELARWVEKHIFLPVAKMQGFIDEEESKEIGEVIYLYPRIEWNDLRLRDNTNLLQMYLTMQQSGLMSMQTLLEKFELDYDLEIERLREEQISVMQNGQVPGGPGGMGGMGGGGGGSDAETPESEDDTEEPEEPQEPQGDPIESMVTTAQDLLNQTNDPNLILKSLKGQIQTVFQEPEHALGLVKALYDTQDSILQAVAQRLYLFLKLSKPS